MVRKSVRILIVLGVTAAIVVGAALPIKHKKQELAAAPKYGVQPTPVRATLARQGDLRKVRDYLAVVEPIRVADVSARLTATVEKVLHDENEPVKAGDVLVLLDGRQIEDSIATAGAQIEEAQAELASNQATVASLEKSSAYWQREAGRDKVLVDKGVVAAADAEATADKADEAKGKLDAAELKSAAIERQAESLQRRRAELQTQLSYCTIRSPFDGLVSHRMVDPGDLASPGKTLMIVEDRSRLRLCFDVPQQDLPRVREGLPGTYSVDGEQRKATLSHMYPSLDAARMLRAEVHLDGGGTVGLASGAYVPLHVVLGVTKDVTLVPAASVVESPDGKPHVFAAQAGCLAALPISILGATGEDVAVQGVAAGQQVVLSTFLGWAQLSGGMKVEALQ
jgi:RND family efflux transporter MFP subunit